MVGAASKPTKKSGPKATGSGSRPRTGQRQSVTLPDGTQVPTAIPAGMDPATAKEVMEYLRNNPEAAKAALQQAQRMQQQQPGMAQQMMGQNLAQRMQDPAFREKMAILREDPELKEVFDDIAEHGSAGLGKYWDNMDVMSRISQRMAAMDIGPGHGLRPSQPEPTNLHEAAKQGNVEKCQELLAGGADANAKDGRGITPLGVAVGFNRVDVIAELLKAGADVAVTDSQGNIPLHYAAGYGRKQVAGMLLKAGSDPDCQNKDGQKPIDAAKMNKETLLVELLQSWDSAASKSTPADGANNLNGHAHKANGSAAQSASDQAEAPVLSKPT
ncbi:hypothetical protein WJX74_002667 [Apatococcus lobatus]|uniref:Uncharacterized protein n=1 Tax=Apatococcus lobatus TaxID=904363 RepID=A0AAW1REF5_9CHLO